MTTADSQMPDSAELLEEKVLGEIAELMGSVSNLEFADDDLAAYEIITMEEQVAHYVSAGELEPLMHIGVPEASAPPEGVDATTHLRFLLASLNAICLHAAVDGGVSMRICWGLNSQLAKRIVTCSSVEELRELASFKIIPLSYCLLVRELTISGVTDKDVMKAIRYIHNHHRERVMLGEIAGHVGLSPEYFSAKFKRETGMTVSAYISHARIQEAEALLRFTNLSIGEIAAQLAYSSQSHFQSAFKRETGTTPQQYRMSVIE